MPHVERFNLTEATDPRGCSKNVLTRRGDEDEAQIRENEDVRCHHTTSGNEKK